MIYLDNAGTTAVLEECVEIYKKYQLTEYFNPSAPYHNSLVLSKEIKKAREDMLKYLRAGNGQIIFTSSGSESDNLALFGTKKINGSRIIVSNSEHPAIYNSAMELKQRGYDVVFCDVDSTGRVIEEKFIELINDNTSLVSIMHVNNETGCVNDIKKLCKIAKNKKREIIFHSDGVQALGKININISDLGVDLYTISGHKIHAPKGIAGLYVKDNVHLKPLIFGGGQENGIRSSTENVGGIMAFAYAIKEAIKTQEENCLKLKTIREDLTSFLKQNDCVIVDSAEQSEFILCFAMKHVRGEVMLHSLEKYGILIGTGSACSSKKGYKRLPSILKLKSEYVSGIIRLSFSRFTQENDIEYFKKCFNLEYKNLIKYVK